MRRLTDAKECEAVISSYPEFKDFDSERWFNQPLNYALIKGDDAGFAEYVGNQIYWVHFVYNSARGRAAINLAKAMLADLLSNRQFNHCVGIIAINNKKAKWVVRQIGMKSLGEVDTKIGRCELFYLEGNRK